MTAVVSALGFGCWGTCAVRKSEGSACRALGGRARRAAAAREGPQRGRVILGRYQRQLVASEQRTSVLVVAPTQPGSLLSASSYRARLVTRHHGGGSPAATGLIDAFWSIRRGAGQESFQHRTRSYRLAA